MMKKVIIMAAVVILLCAGIAAAQAEENITTKDAEKALAGMNDTMQKMIDDGFKVQRINDTFIEAGKILEAQRFLEEKKKAPDYSLVMKYRNEISDVKEQAYTAKDTIYSTEKTYSTFRDKTEKYGANISDIDGLMDSMKKEFRDERYEKVIEIANEAESMMAEREASLTTFDLYYRTATRSIKDFFIENYRKIGIISFAALLAIIIFWREAYRLLLKLKLKRLMLEKKILLDMIKKTQKQYFEEGRMPASVYNIRTKKFAEMVRDIQRQIPLFEEQLAKIRMRHQYEGSNLKKEVEK